MRKIVLFLFASLLVRAAAVAAPGEPQLLRVSYHSEKMNAERDYFVYLPRGFTRQNR